MNIKHIEMLILGAWMTMFQVVVGYPSANKNNSTCVLWGEIYKAGHSFVDRAETNTGDYCVTCLCTKSGEMQCNRWACSNLVCNDDEDNEECCSVCDGDKAESVVSPAGDGDSAEASDWTPSSAENSEPIICSHEHRTYRDGESFASNNTGLQKQQSDQCVQCVCQGGMVLCRLKTCSIVNCQTPEYSREDCCPTCPGEATANQKSEFESAASTELDGIDCLLNGLLHKDGEQWHPVVGPFGQLDCVVCQCKKGQVVCERLTCSEELPCNTPQKVRGQCCPVCPTNQESLADQTNSKKTGHKCSLNETFVYRRQMTINSHTEYYQYAFQSPGGAARLISWTVKDGRSGDYSEQYLTTSEFSNFTDSFKFKLVGASKNKLILRFVKRARKMAEKCGNRCERRQERLENSLKLKDATHKNLCMENV